jgi:hypothetical protein
VKVCEADGAKVHVYKAGKTRSAGNGAGDGMLGGLMMYVCSFGVEFVILNW